MSDELYAVDEWADAFDEIDAPECPNLQWLATSTGHTVTWEEYALTNARIAKTAAAHERMCADEIAQMQARKAAHKRRGEKARQRIAYAFAEGKLGKRIKDGVVTVSITKPRERLVVQDMDLLTREWIKVTEAPLLADLQDHYKRTGEIVDGCDVVEGDPGVSIR